jgi:hypothetical protein
VLYGILGSDELILKYYFLWWFCSSSIAGSLAAAITSPLDMAKLRIQVRFLDWLIYYIFWFRLVSLCDFFFSFACCITNQISRRGAPIHDSGSTSANASQQVSVGSVLRDAIRRDGWMGLFRGAGARVSNLSLMLIFCRSWYYCLCQFSILTYCYVAIPFKQVAFHAPNVAITMASFEYIKSMLSQTNI